MRVLLATLGSRGDVEPFLWLARALQEDGHTVRVLGPDEVDQGTDDLDVASLGVGFTDLAQSMQEGSMVRAYRDRIRPAMGRALAGVVEAAMEWQPQVIVSHPKLVTVPVVAERLGVPHLLVELTPTLTPTKEYPAAGVASRSLGPVLNRFTYRTVGLAGLMFGGDVREARSRLGVPGAALPAPEGTLAAFSPTLLPRPSDWPATTHQTGDWHGPPVDHALTAELREFLAVDAPFLYAGFGSMVGGDAAARASAIVDGARRSGLRVLMATGWGGIEPPGHLGPDVLTARSVPHDAVLPQAALAIHHGGAGTVHTAVRAGVPSIVVPFLGDQPFWAAQLHHRGLAGPALSKDRLTGDAVRTAIVDGLDRRERVRSAARAMAAEDGARTAAALVAGSAGPQPGP